MQIGAFTLHNEEKVRRAIEQAGTDEQAILAAYDKLGGYISKGNRKVKNGSLDAVVYSIPVNGTLVDVPEGEALPLEVQAADILAEAAAKPKKVNKK